MGENITIRLTKNNFQMVDLDDDKIIQISIDPKDWDKLDFIPEQIIRHQKIVENLENFLKHHSIAELNWVCTDCLLGLSNSEDVALHKKKTGHSQILNVKGLPDQYISKVIHPYFELQKLLEI
ncbi:hypothetical protein [Nitrosopumilus sp.]|uniref:hypothetical protein n=1 Tax=Nitrosopumilus sp. TaxID=2024843 RepID=UPI003B5B19C1